MGIAKNFTQILFKPIKKIMLIGIPFFYGWFALIRDEFLPIEWKEKLRLFGIFNMLAWYWWVIIGLVAWVCWTAWDYAKSLKDKSNLPSIESEVKNRSQAIIIGRDNLAPIFQHQIQERNIENRLSKQINLKIEPQEKIIDGKQYIIIVITNIEDTKIFCRIEINGIYDETNKNILRDISQFANHFSWFGENTLDDGMKEMKEGLDGTVTIGFIHSQSCGFYWLFHEDPNKNWQKPGIYRLNLKIKGTIGGVGFVGVKLIIEIQYIMKEESNDSGEYFNRGKLILLNNFL